MTLGRSNPIGAFCILCHDADTVLPFYRDVLGFEPRRAEESFYHFALRDSATSLCLWEIGHVARHTVYSVHPETAIPTKVALALAATSMAEVDDLHDRLSGAGVRMLTKPERRGGVYAFHFIDPCAVIWEIHAPVDAPDRGDRLRLDRITLLCTQLAATQAFYEGKLGFPPIAATDGRVFYPPVDGSSLSLWDVTAAAARLGLDELPAQRSRWPATTAMLAYSFETIDQVRGLHDALSAAGVSFDEAPAHFAWDFKACYFRDPEDNIWELFEMPSNIEQRMLPRAG